MGWKVKSASDVEEVWVEVDDAGAEIPGTAHVKYLESVAPSVVATDPLIVLLPDLPADARPLPDAGLPPIPFPFPGMRSHYVEWAVAGAAGGLVVAAFQLIVHLL